MSPFQPHVSVKTLEIEENLKKKVIDYIQNNVEFDSIWSAIDNFHQKGGFELLVHAFHTCEAWRGTRHDATPCIISVQMLLTILPRYQLKLTEQYPAPDNGESSTMIKLVLGACEEYGSIDTQRAALSLIVSVACGPFRANSYSLNLVRDTSPYHILIVY
eukprot:sb/3472911/